MKGTWLIFWDTMQYVQQPHLAQLGNRCTPLQNRWVGVWNNTNTCTARAPYTVLPLYQQSAWLTCITKGNGQKCMIHFHYSTLLHPLYALSHPEYTLLLPGPLLHPLYTYLRSTFCVPWVFLFPINEGGSAACCLCSALYPSFPNTGNTRRMQSFHNASPARPCMIERMRDQAISIRTLKHRGAHQGKG